MGVACRKNRCEEYKFAAMPFDIVMSLPMLELHKESLINLFRQAQVLNAQPFENQTLCLQIQETLIRKIIYQEHQIRRLRLDADQLKHQLRQSDGLTPSRDEVRRITQQIHDLNERIADRKYIIQILRQIGDALAFSYLDKWDIRPLAAKQPPGFLSGKKGFRKELFFVRRIFKAGRIALLNDITNCLRYGDITS
jgi:hypothetical protein